MPLIFLYSGKQQGAALLFSLIFLLVLTVIGVASMNDTIVQGKMAGAIQDSNVALQGVETAVRAAEEYIDGLGTVGDFGASAGLYSEGAIVDGDGDELDFYASSTWTNAYSIEAGAIAGQAEQPRYLIELAGEVTSDDTELALNINTYSHESGGGQILGFRIVARGTGGTGTSQRIVESYYGKRF